MKQMLIAGLAMAAMAMAGTLATAVPAMAQDLPEVCRGQDGTGLKAGFANLAESSDFAVIVREGIQRVAEACNLELVVADNDRDPVKTLDNVNNFIAQEVQGIIEFNSLRDLGDAICDIAGDRPVLAVDIPLEPCAVFMGADNRGAGEVGGRGVGAVVKEMWNCEVDAIVTFEAPHVGQINTDRMNGQLAGLKEVCPDLEMGNFEDWAPTVENSIITRIEGFQIDPAFERGRDYLTTQPDSEHIVALCLNDDGCLGFHSAVEEAGRAGQVIFATQGANSVTHDLIRNDAYFAGGAGYFSERYGELLVPNIIRMIKGDGPESDPLLMTHIFINADNIDELYPKN